MARLPHQFLDRCRRMYKMKVLFINTYCNGSTGQIVNDISSFLEQKGNEVVKCYGREEKRQSDWIYCGTNFVLNFISNVLTFLTGKIGSFHLIETRKLIKTIQKEKPDIIHIHNLHGNYLNFKRLFLFLKDEYDGKVVFTAHDDFLYTGRCASAGCDFWKTGCKKCPLKNQYPHAFIDLSKKLFLEKKQFLNSLNASFVFPSGFMLNNSKQSLMDFKNVYCIPNGLKISNKIMSSNENLSPFMHKEKINILCVASPWNKDKGIDFINYLSNHLDGSKFNIIVVGITKKDKKYFENAKNITKIGYLEKDELSYLYCNSDLLLVASRRESFSLVTLESMMHGLPIVSLDTGAARDLIDDECGIVVEQDKNSLLDAINSFSPQSYNRDIIKEKANKYSLSNMVEAYYALYCEILKRE